MVFEPIWLIFDQFLPIFSGIYHQKVLRARVYLSRCVYLALYGSRNRYSQYETASFDHVDLYTEHNGVNFVVTYDCFELSSSQPHAPIFKWNSPHWENFSIHKNN